MDSAPDCCTIRGAVAGFESLTIIRTPKCLANPGYIINNNNNNNNNLYINTTNIFDVRSQSVW